MKNIVILFLSSLLLIFSACKEEDQTIKVKGKVSDPKTGQGVAAATIILDNKPVSSSVYNAGYQKLASADTKSDGTYELKYEKEKSSDYRIRVRKDGYFLLEKEYPPQKFESDSEVNLNFGLQIKGYVRTHLKNVSNYNQDDHIVFRFPDMEQQCADCCPSDYLHGYGQYFDSIFVCAAPGNNWLRYEYSVTISGSTNLYGPDSVYVKASDTVNLNVNY